MVHLLSAAQYSCFLVGVYVCQTNKLLCQNFQWEDFWCHPSTLLCPKSQWEDFCVTNQHAVLSELPKGQFCVPNHVRIPNGVILCAKPCQNSQWGDSVCQTSTPLCQNSQWGWFCVPNHVRISNGLCTLQLDQNISSVAKPIALHQTPGMFSFLGSVGLGHILEF